MLEVFSIEAAAESSVNGPFTKELLNMSVRESELRIGQDSEALDYLYACVSRPKKMHLGLPQSRHSPVSLPAHCTKCEVSHAAFGRFTALHKYNLQPNVIDSQPEPT